MYHLRTTTLPFSQSRDKLCTFICLSILTSCIFSLQFIMCKLFHCLSHRLTALITNSIIRYTRQYTYSHTHVYIYVFLHKRSMQKYATKVTQVPLPMIFILDDPLSIHKTLPHHIKKNSKNFYLFN